MLTIKTVKVYECKYCDCILGSKQALSRHQIHRPKRCLLVDKIIEPKVVPDVSSGVKLTSNDLRLQIELLQLKLLEQENLTPEQLKIMELEKENKVLKDELEILKTNCKDSIKYKEFYYKYMIEDTQTLLFFDTKDDTVIKDLENRLTEKLTPAMIKMEHVGLALVLYEFLIPKFFRVLKVCDRYIIKTKDKDGYIIEDIDMMIMKNCIKPTLLRYLNCYIDECNEDSDLVDSIELLIKDITYNRVGQLFNSQIYRLIDLSDGKEVRKNIEKLTYMLKK